MCRLQESFSPGMERQTDFVFLYLCAGLTNELEHLI